MRLLPVLVLTTPLVAVAACGQESQENVPRSATLADTGAMADTAQVEPIRAGHITVTVSCRERGFGSGARIRPWNAHSGGDTAFVWHLVPVPANTAIPTELTAVDPQRWPLADDTVTWSQGMVTVPIANRAQDTAKYRLKIVCPAEADTIVPDTIVIDPLVIIDPSASADTTQSRSN